MYKSHFQKLGISSTEYDLYVQLYRYGASSVLQLSKRLNLPRTTIYQNLEKLLKIGMVNRVVDRNRKLFVAEEIDKLKEIISQKEQIINGQSQSLLKIKDSLNDMLVQFKLLKPKEIIPHTELKYFEGEDEVRNVYKKMLLSKEIRSYPHASWIPAVMPDVTQLFYEIIQQGNIIVKDIFANHASAEIVIPILKNVSNYKYKTVGSSAFTAFENIDYSIYDNKITIIHGPNPIIAVLIENQFMHNHAKYIFDILWDLLPDINE